MCGGASSTQQQIQQLQVQQYQQAIAQSKQIFGDASQIFNEINSTFSPILQAGPSQYGYNQAEDTALRSGATEGNAQAYASSARTLKENLAAQGGILPSGLQTKMLTGLSTYGNQQLSNEQNQITNAGFAQGNANWLAAANALGGSTNIFNPGTGAISASTGAGSAAEKTASDIWQENQAGSWTNAVSGALGGIVSGAASGLSGGLGTAVSTIGNGNFGW